MIDDSVLATAEKVEPLNVGSHAAIHLAMGLALRADAPSAVMLTYDKALAAAAARYGFRVLEPA